MDMQDLATQQARHEANNWGEYDELIPLVENILDDHTDMLTDQEEAWVYHYLQFIKYRNVSCPNTIADEAERIICSIHDL